MISLISVSYVTKKGHGKKKLVFEQKVSSNRNKLYHFYNYKGTSKCFGIKEKNI